MSQRASATDRSSESQRQPRDLSSVRSVDKALQIVELLMRDGRSLSAREIAIQTGIERTTVHRLINALIHRDWLERADGAARYRLALKLLVLAKISHDSRDILDSVRPALEQLSIVSRETVHVGVLDDFEIVHVDKVDSPERVGISSRIGARGVPHVTALGKALLAASEPDRVERYIAHAEQRRDAFSLTDPNRLRRDLEQTRHRGYSRDDEEDAIGVRCIGAAVRAQGGTPLFAVSVTGPAGRFTAKRATACVPALLDTVATMSRRFGWQAAHDNALAKAARLGTELDPEERRA